MSDIRCPMCGKTNPEQEEICQFCQARIKPLLVNYDENESDQSIKSEDEFEATDSGIPDWLRNLRQDESRELFGNEDQGFSAEKNSSTDFDENQTWLSDLRSDQRDESDESEEYDFSSSGEEGNIEDDDSFPDQEIPEWLKNIRSQPADSEIDDQKFGAETYQPPFVESESDEVVPNQQDHFLPEASSFTSISDRYEPKQDVSDDVDEKIDDEYDWVSEFVELEKENDKQPDMQSFPGSLEKIEDSQEIPDWLADLASYNETDTPHKEDVIPEWLSGDQLINEQVSEVFYSPGNDYQEQTPEWSDEPLQSPGAEESETDEPIPEFFQGTIPPFTVDIENFIGDEFPEWLDSAPAHAVQDIDESVLEDDARIQRGDLPDWLQAMRPVETISSGHSIVTEQDNRIESAGPLIGMQGALPAEPDIARAKKTPVYSSRLQVSEKHQLQANLIEQIIKSEGEPVAMHGKPILATQQFLRIAIFTCLFLALLVPMVLGIPKAPPNQFSPEAFMLSRLINQLPGNAPVLLAVDYSASLSGELDAASLPVIDQLMIKGANLTIVSTIPTGPMQAERLIQLANQVGGHKYQMSIQYDNLGYLPGGVTGLLGMAELPRQLFPYNLLGELAWQDSRLSGIYRLADFSMILVLTDDPETARTWIEQVQPELGDTPLGFVVAAQVEPVIAPYLADSAKQIQGLVSGLSGGYSYEILMVRPGIASNYWSSYSVGVLVVLILVIGISLFNGGIQLINQTRKMGHKEQS